MFGAIAQLGERLHGMQEVSGSIPLGSTNTLDQQIKHNLQVWAAAHSALGIRCLLTVYQIFKNEAVHAGEVQFRAQGWNPN